MFYLTTMTLNQFNRYMSGEWTGRSNGTSCRDSIELIGVDPAYKGALYALAEEQGYDVAVIVSVGEDMEDYAPAMAQEWAGDRITCPRGINKGMFAPVSWGYIDSYADGWAWVVRVPRWLNR